jgi:hypothetical protein
MEVAQIADIISSLGIVGGLILAVWAFLNRKVVPEKTYQEALEIERKASDRASEIIAKELVQNLSDGVKSGISQGIAEGYLKINGERKKQ